MSIGARVSLILVVTMGLGGAGFVSAVLAQNPHSAPPGASQLETTEPAPAGDAAAGGMMAAMQADQRKLDELVAAMNAAGRADKLDRVAAVITQMAAQRGRMVEQMRGMHDGMMKTMMTSGDHKMPEQNARPTEHEQHHPQR